MLNAYPQIGNNNIIKTDWNLFANIGRFIANSGIVKLSPPLLKRFLSSASNRTDYYPITAVDLKVKSSLAVKLRHRNHLRALISIVCVVCWRTCCAGNQSAPKPRPSTLTQPIGFEEGRACGLEAMAPRCCEHVNEEGAWSNAAIVLCRGWATGERASSEERRERDQNEAQRENAGFRSRLRERKRENATAEAPSLLRHLDALIAATDFSREILKFDFKTDISFSVVNKAIERKLIDLI